VYVLYAAATSRPEQFSSSRLEGNVSHVSGSHDEDPATRSVEHAGPAVSAADIHGRAGHPPATADEVAVFHEDSGPFEIDDEG
jgi:hypothetical protein